LTGDIVNFNLNIVKTNVTDINIVRMVDEKQIITQVFEESKQIKRSKVFEVQI